MEQSVLLFIVASLTLNLIPGPDVVYIVSNTLRAKVSGGILAAAGLGVGYLFHTLAAVLGLSAVVMSSALLFSVVKFIGAAYLIYLGISILRSTWQGKSAMNIETEESIVNNRNVFTQGVIVSILNPKVALFFLSFLPQFVSTNAENIAFQLLYLGIVFSVLATLCNTAYAIVGGMLFGHPAFSRSVKAVESVSGTLLVGLGVTMALKES
ncbi:LysE family translocator [Parasalinivibrio latis]|uniref:LysE family translocator n=1 Tax=Parasalinivibrio latis TaxID=2952610 RepID=UPI0030E521B5